MTDFIQNFHFLRPWVLLFFILPIIFYFKKIGLKNLYSSWENICDKNLLDFLLSDKARHKKISIGKYFYTGLIAAIIAAAGPSWKKIEIPTFVIENPSMIVLSLAQDMQLTDVSPSRLGRSKFIISDIADSLPEGQFGLEVYSQEPYVITPLTDDVKIIKSLLPQITPDIVPDQGDRLDRAIDLAIERFKSAGYSSGNIILFASDIGQRFDLALEKAEAAAKLKYSLNIFDASFSGNDKLQLLAEKGNGLYMSIKNPDISKLVGKVKTENQDKVALSQNLRSTFLDYGYYLVFICLICMMPFFRRGLLILFLCCFSLQAHAGLFMNNNQEGLSLFEQQQYDKALEKFDNSLWKGVTLYKMDKQEEALKEFSKEKTDKNLYNAGVILTKMCKYEEALKMFNEALELNPKNEDATYNKKVLEELFEKAKEDPSVLKCQDEQEQQQQQQNQNQQNNSENNQNQEENQSDQNQDQNQNQDRQQEQQQQSGQQNQQDENNDNSQQNNNDQQQQSQENSSDKNNSENEQNQNQQQSEQQQSDQQNDEQQKNEDSSQNKENNDKEDNSSNQQSTADNDQNQKPDEKGNQPDKANNDDGDEQKSQNKEGNDNNGSEMQEEEVEAQVMNAKEGDDDTEYNEEALALQRRYREIPEDVGGLLREFIRKEYRKDRYHDENN